MIAPQITFDAADPLLTWQDIAKSIEDGHGFPKADIRDSVTKRGEDSLLVRSAWIDGMGIAVKTATVFPENQEHGEPSVNGGMMLFADLTGVMEAVVDFHLVTKWKTAGDSLLAAQRLARKDSRTMLILGAGNVAETLVSAYASQFPGLKFAIWSRRPESAAKFVTRFAGKADLRVAGALQEEVHQADIVASATMSTEPLIRGEWLRPGQHLDLIGAYRPDMREADDKALQRASIFVDSRDTTLPHIGELLVPLKTGAIKPEDILADYYDIKDGLFERSSADEITLFKNGGGAHLDLMTAKAILQIWTAAQK
jgi:ornithine cyclodeaminase/alanine dehydrogenase-like protein (mu-crystallin family)